SFLRCTLVAALLALGACGDNDNTPIVPDSSAGSGKMSLTGNGSGSSGDRSASDYRLGPNDRTRIIVYGQPNLTGEVVLDGSGNMGRFYTKRQVDGKVVRVAGTQESRLQPGDTVVVRERYF